MGLLISDGKITLPSVRIVITGTRTIVEYQRQTMFKVLDSYTRRYPRALYITGACEGVDDWAAIHLGLHCFNVYTVVPANRDHVARHFAKYCKLYELMPEGTSYMDRNQRMVDITDGATKKICLAFPDEPETIRSGTWSTVRRARKSGLKEDVTQLGDTI